jgi:diguanylate cyclase (GGDEF)-like protein
MAYGRIKGALKGEAAAPGAATAGGAEPSSVPLLRMGSVQREMQALRFINAGLLHELAVVKAREAQTQQLADRDGLTGVYNRRRTLELLESAIAEAALQGQQVGLLFIDLNGFKTINDTYGHDAGDKILTTAAARISARVRTGDIVGRYGGDEFVVVLPSVPDPLAMSRVADSIRERVSLPCWINGEEQHLTAAIGESLYPHDGETASLLLRRADQAMYRLKARLARPLVSLGSVPVPRLSRRRNDKCKPRASGDP